jgi:RNA polymerase sigma-70 factor (ECF subfamily)
VQEIPSGELAVTSVLSDSVILDGERGAAEAILRRDIEAIFPKLRRYARSLTRDVVDADDLVQECLARALAKIHLWEAGTDLRAWLFSILHNQYVTQGRRSTREGTSVAWSACAPALTCAPCQIDHLEFRELERAIKSLPEQQRTAVLLISLTRRNYYEVAAACDVPVGTIRSRLARGRKALRALTGIAPPQPRISARREASPKSCAGAKLPNLARGASVVG